MRGWVCGWVRHSNFLSAAVRALLCAPCCVLLPVLQACCLVLVCLASLQPPLLMLLFPPAFPALGPLQDVFGGAQGPVADALNLNAGVALAAANVAGDAKEGVAMAQEAQRRWGEG